MRDCRRYGYISAKKQNARGQIEGFSNGPKADYTLRNTVAKDGGGGFYVSGKFNEMIETTNSAVLVESCFAFQILAGTSPAPKTYMWPGLTK